MPSFPLGRSILLGFIVPCLASAQNFLPLDFSQNVQPVDSIYPNNSTLGPEYYSGISFDFLNVTTSNGLTIDARVTVIQTSGSYEFVGWIPDYDSAPEGPAGDLGVYYRHDGDFSEPTGGITYMITFYEGGGAFSTEAILPDFRLLIYDHDGEPGQSEGIRTYVSDGFTGYQIYGGSGIQAADESGAWSFEAGGQNLSETGPEGSFIAYYQNTSSIRFDLFATTDPSNPAANSGVFAGFDGDLSLTGGLTGGFGTYVPVPEPTVFPLLMLSISLMMTRRKRVLTASKA